MDETLVTTATNATPVVTLEQRVRVRELQLNEAIARASVLDLTIKHGEAQSELTAFFNTLAVEGYTLDPSTLQYTKGA